MLRPVSRQTAVQAGSSATCIYSFKTNRRRSTTNDMTVTRSGERELDRCDITTSKASERSEPSVRGRSDVPHNSTHNCKVIESCQISL